MAPAHHIADVDQVKGKAAALKVLHAAGACVVQDGDGEAAGHAPVAAIELLVELIQPFRRRTNPQ